jgi:hypothetical protein
MKILAAAAFFALITSPTSAEMMKCGTFNGKTACNKDAMKKQESATQAVGKKVPPDEADDPVDPDKSGGAQHRMDQRQQQRMQR